MSVSVSLALGSVIAAVVGAIASGANMALQDKTNEENREHADALTTAQWERDDTSLQRQVADAKAAGLSPLSVTGSQASSPAIMSQAQAPQFDVSQILGSVDQSLALDSNERIASENRKSQNSQFDREFWLECYKADSQIEQAKAELEQSAIEHKDLMLQGLNELQYQYDVLNDQIDTHNGDVDALYSEKFQERLENLSQRSYETYSNFCSVLGIPAKMAVYDKVDEYYTALSTFTNLLNLENLNPDLVSSSDGGSLGFSIAGFGLNGGDTNASSADVTRQNSAKMMETTEKGKTNYLTIPVYKFNPSKYEKTSYTGTASSKSSKFSKDDFYF